MLSKSIFYQVENKWISVCVQLIKVKNWNSPIIFKEIRAVIKKSLNYKKPGPDRVSFGILPNPQRKT